MNVDDDPPEGLIVHAAGEVDGKWRLVDVWESEAAYERFRDSRLMPAVVAALGQEAVDAGPPAPGEPPRAGQLDRPARLGRTSRRQEQPAGCGTRAGPFDPALRPAIRPT